MTQVEGQGVFQIYQVFFALSGGLRRARAHSSAAPAGSSMAATMERPAAAQILETPVENDVRRPGMKPGADAQNRARKEECP